MNQILAIENKKKEKKQKKQRNSGPLEIKGIVRFFGIVIMIFGIVLAGQGSYAIYKDFDDRKPANIPYVSVGRVNDKAILYVEHNVEIATISYSWNNGEETVIPVGNLTAQEMITLLNDNSTLNITIEDINGKQVSYQKQFLLEGVDITKPVIDIKTADGNDKMTITATDETAILYLSYQWDDEEPVIIDYETEGQTEIKQDVPLTPGTRTITIKAEDLNGNIEQIEKEIVTSTSKPKMTITQNKNEIIVGATDTDGVKDIVINLNGKRYSARDINLKEVQVGPLTLQEGNNTISIEVTNVSGYTETATTELQYTP